MPRPTAPKIELHPRHRDLLQSYLSKSSIPAHYQKRVSILLYIDEGLGVLATSRKLPTSAPTVSKWTKRWLANFDDLCAYEAQQSPSDSALLSRMLAILSDAPRTGSPPRISLSEKEKLMALACQKPKDFGIPLSAWNREMLAKVAIAEGIVEKISGGYVSKILKKSGHSSS